MKEKESIESTNILFYVIIIGTFSIALFLYGFFPLMNYDNTIATIDDVPKFIENVRIKTSSLYQPMVKKLIIMVIDALRWDFITGSIAKVAMPVTSSLIANHSACLLQTKVQSPTVTMPRIKALMTGTVPSFIDIALNFGSKPVPSDNILLQVKKQDQKLIFYGDETWLTLFPNLFERYHGTTSFFVTDFTEVDHNVTRHIDNELNNNNDWSIMILHYLGLDHIGHVHGPFSPFIKPKLKEMDNIINKIQLKIQEWNQNDDSSLFIICGDHGMKDSGGHGGSTLPETTVPFIAIGSKCFQKHNEYTEIAQIDITSTLSVILGVPIPFSNLGSVFVDKLYDLPISKKLYVLHYNAKQLFNHFQKVAGYETEFAHQKYLEANKLHVAWLNTKNHPNDMADDIVFSYHAALKGMKDILVNNMIKYDTYIITTAIFFLCHIICILIGKQRQTIFVFQKVICFIALNLVLWCIIISFWESEGISLLYSKDFASIILLLLMIVIFCTNCCLLSNIQNVQFLKIEATKNGKTKLIFLFGALIHALSFGGSSFVEEEHQTWYFYWVTFLTVLLYIYFAKHHAQLQLDSRKSLNVQICIKLLLLLVGHRILRKLNSTGDKYAYLPDIAGYLKEPENIIAMTCVLVTALILLIWISFTHEEKKYKQKSVFFNILISICIYLRHMHNGTVAKIPLYPDSRGIHEVQMFWALILIFCITYIYRLILKYNQTQFMRNALFFTVQIWIMISAMLHQPYNVILVPFQIIFITVIRTAIEGDNVLEHSAIIYAWCGNLFYFYQGNSNSLATVDVGAGYIGVQSYMPLVHGTLLIINTYSAPVLAYLLLVYHAVIHSPYNEHKNIIQTSKLYITWRLLPLTVYTIIITIQRHHLFVWSVFSPKLLYEVTHTVITFFIVSMVLIIMKIQKVLNSYKA